MAVYKCKMCGGALEVSGDSSVATCEYCGSVQTLPKKNDDVIANLFNRANNLRIKCEFDKASEVYEKILNEDNTDSEAHWGLVLCKYGIEYVEDPKTYKRIPTCHRTQYESVLTDVDYFAAVSNADAVSADVYKAQAEEIANLQKDILAIVKNEKPFDVFICYKETDENGKRTVDSTLANDIYYQLTQEGLKVFYAAITLEDKLGVEYEPYIFAALNSAKVMLVVGTKPEYFDAVWVKNEWSRYLKLMKADRSKLLIPCYRDMDAYDLPEEFSHLQAQDMGKIGFVNDVVRGIKKIVSSSETKTETAVKENVASASSAGTAPLLKRAFIFLEDGDWQSADEYCEKVLDLDPECAEAYLGKLMAELKVKKREKLEKCDSPFNKSNNYQKAIRFDDSTLKTELESYIFTINERNENNRLMLAYNNAISAMNTAKTESEYKLVAVSFKAIKGYKDSAKLAEKCFEKADEAKNNSIYNDAKFKMDSVNALTVEEAIRRFEQIPGWRDADECIISCKKKIEEIKVKDEIVRIERERCEEEARIERERKAEIARIESEKRKKLIKKVSVIVSPIVAVVVAFMIVFNSVIMPQIKLNNAIDLLEANDHKGAYVLIDEIVNSDLMKKKIYNRAIKFIESEKYEIAYVLLNKIGESDFIKENKYIRAIDLMKKSEFDSAIELFKNLREYKDSSVYIENCYIGLYGEKYYNIVKDIKVGKEIELGCYEQDNNFDNGPEAIKWTVVKNENGYYILVANKNLDCKKYNDIWANISWENCTLRSWLGTEFIKTAFSTEEKSFLQPNTLGDLVWIMSKAEYSEYGNDSGTENTLYAVSQGVYNENGKGWSWLRDNGVGEDHACEVDCTGNVNTFGSFVDCENTGVRPVVMIYGGALNG